MGGLFNSTVLDVAIGLVFVYLLLAIICTAINEFIVRVLGSREKYLQRGIQELLNHQAFAAGQDEDGFLAAFYGHPLISGLVKDGKRPAYLAARTFAAAVVHMLTPDQPGSITFQDLENGVNDLPPGEVKSALTGLLRRTNGELEKAEQAVENWFNDTMDCVSGWYKRHIQVITLIVGITLTIVANADTIGIARQLWVAPVLRARIVGAAALGALQNPSATTEGLASNSSVLTVNEKTALGELLGWGTIQFELPWDNVGALAAWLLRVFGWLMTVFAISLGAPFWFDVLNKFMNIRSAGKSPNEAPKTS